jgi:chromosome partitioning protein
MPGVEPQRVVTTCLAPERLPGAAWSMAARRPGRQIGLRAHPPRQVPRPQVRILQYCNTAILGVARPASKLRQTHAREGAAPPVAHCPGVRAACEHGRSCLSLCGMRCDNAWMTGLSVALANLKPGTGKTTSAVWLAHVFAQAGNAVLLVDADPSGSALEWSDLAAMDPGLPPQAAFPFRIVALPSRELHRRIPEIARTDDVVIIDAPQLEDHAGIARSALRYADEILIPCAPSPIEINRTTPVRDEISEIEAVRDSPARSAILLNRCITRAHSTADAREALEGLGYDVLGTAVPRLEVYAQSFGLPIRHTGRDVWRHVAHDLIERCLPLCSVRS